jgi:CheY-like chemotaxis protein
MNNFNYREDLNKGDIIVIDDNQADLQLMKLAFEEIGLRNNILFFSDGRKTLDHLATKFNPIFMVICDIRMPTIDGLELRRELDKNLVIKIATIPFIFMSNSTNKGDVRNAYSITAQGYFEKPENFELLVSMLKLILCYWTTSAIPQ